MSSPSFEENPFQRLSAGGAISRAFSLLFERKEVFLPIGALCYIPLVAVAATMLHLTGSAVAAASQEAGNQEEANAEYTDYSSYFGAQQDFHAGSFLGQLLVEFVLLDIVIILAKGAIVYAVASMYTQRKPNLGSSLKQGWSRWCDLFATGLLVSFAVFICYLIMAAFHLGIFSLIGNDSSGLALLVLAVYLVYLGFVIYVVVSLILLTPVIIVEGTTCFACIRRCMELAKGNRCFIFCTVFCIGLVTVIIQTILGMIVIAIHKDGSDVVTTAPVLYGAVTSLTTFLFVPLQIM